jgi:hypothetical protein
MSPLDKDKAIADRCAALGLSLAQAQRLAEADSSTSELAHVLGLDVTTLKPLQPKRWLWMAALTSSVSYKGTLTPEILLACLMNGEVPAAFAAHIGHFLEEAPIMAAEQAAQQSDIPMTVLWHNLARLAVTSDSRRFSPALASTLLLPPLQNHRDTESGWGTDH